MYYYAQLNEENICVGISQLSGEVITESIIPINIMDDDSLLGKHYSNGTWEDVPQEPAPEPTPEPTEQEIIQAEILLNQQQIINRQNEQDIVMAELLLNQQGV